MKQVELWTRAPGTDGMYEISNFGHCRMMFRIGVDLEKCEDVKLPTLTDRLEPLSYDLAKHRFGWWMILPGGTVFFSRTDACAVFNRVGIAMSVDKSGDRESVRLAMEDDAVAKGLVLAGATPDKTVLDAFAYAVAEMPFATPVARDEFVRSIMRYFESTKAFSERGLGRALELGLLAERRFAERPAWTSSDTFIVKPHKEAS